MVPKLVLGCASWGTPGVLEDAASIEPFLEVCEKYGCKQLDTAYAYPGADMATLAEKVMGEADVAAKGFAVDTKTISFVPGTHSYESIIKTVPGQLERLKVKKVHILYLHAPDRSIPFEETHRALNELYEQGAFEHFGLSNYSEDDIQAFLDIAEKNNWVKPSVLQGMYNIVSRQPETKIFPLLKKHNIAYYAWSPLAGGFFSNVKRGQEVAEGGRFDTKAAYGEFFRGLYYKDTVFDASEKLNEIAKKYGISVNEIALRWIRYHSALNEWDGNVVILGARKLSHLTENFEDSNKGALPEEIVKVIEALWDVISKDDKPAYHF
ncbi:NADP-dependent oxidoreductase domain-containing protein [Lipomyces oligophaga]|uniref:NADP-dependent oxidoreductase domain-containing protein n=1 Tax=Lipomyces oligophaga TaxID=45792 RepID=UPI0034CD102D